MKKKGLLVLVLAAIIAGGAFALPGFRLSAGAGGLFTTDLIGGGGGYTSPISSINTNTDMFIPKFAGGGFVFFDATYAELSLGFSGGNASFVTTVNEAVTNTASFPMSLFNIGLLLKFPFGGEKLQFFPLLGIDYALALSVKNENGDTAKNQNGDDISSDFSALWANLGFGMDYSFTENIYLRLDALLGVRMLSKYENDYKEAYKDIMYSIPDMSAGVTVKLAAGYRF